MAFAGPLGTSAARWGMEFEPLDDGQTDAMMWVEVDLKNVMRAIPGRVLGGRIRRVMDIEMAAIKLALEPAAQLDGTRERLISTYRKKAKHYDITSRLFPVPGYPQRAQRLRAVQALGLRPGDTVVDIACGTGLNFSLLEQAVGPEGRIVGVDLTDAMLAQAQHRIEANGWSNIELVQSDAAAFEFPTEVDAILSTYALSQVPACGDVIARGAEALSPGGRWVVLDLNAPDKAPRWLARLGIALVRPFASIDQWMLRRPWETIRSAMQDRLTDLSWSELSFGTAFLAAGSRGPRSAA
jgi:demethylmenaquinone methyltransferase/2-methoxy-6-polyprenyl-1,4-benzoquinol methylase